VSRKSKPMAEFQIECGEHRGLVKAATVGEAWRKLTKNKTEGFAPLARFCEPRGVWRYVEPQWLDSAP
jgi:hypothetical protein